eukprot:10821202-Alexandrium_andersonii.AAC.1
MPAAFPIRSPTPTSPPPTWAHTPPVQSACHMQLSRPGLVYRSAPAGRPPKECNFDSRLEFSRGHGLVSKLFGRCSSARSSELQD